MEELRSTEILDREIQDDARRKVEKALKACEAECDRIASDVAVRVEKTRQEKTLEYGKRLEEYRRDMASMIPLEKQRRLVSFTDTSVRSALEAWFDGLGEDKRLMLYSEMLERFREPLAGLKINAIVTGVSITDAEKIVKGIFGKENVLSVGERSALGVTTAPFSDGIYIVSEDSLVICRATIEEIRQSLLATKRQELAESLMGGRLPE